MNVVISGSVRIFIIYYIFSIYLYLSINQPPPPPPQPLFTAGSWRSRGGSVDVLTLFFVVLGGFLLLGMLLYRITTQLQQADQAIGALMQTIFKKLENIPDGISDQEQMNPFQQMIGALIQTKMNESTINRDGDGQFTRAEIIPPD